MSKYDNKLIIIEKYTEFVNYIYPVLQNVQRKHGVLKSETLTLILSQVELLYRALNEIEKLNKFLASWGGHLRSADSHNLIKFINKEMNNARASI